MILTQKVAIVKDRITKKILWATTLPDHFHHIGFEIPPVSFDDPRSGKTIREILRTILPEKRNNDTRSEKYVGGDAFIDAMYALSQCKSIIISKRGTDLPYSLIINPETGDGYDFCIVNAITKIEI